MRIELSDIEDIVNTLRALKFSKINRISREGSNVQIKVVNVADKRFETSRLLLTLVDARKFEFLARESIFDILYSDPIRIKDMLDIEVNELEVSTVNFKNDIVMVSCIPDADESKYSIGDLVFSCCCMTIESEP